MHIISKKALMVFWSKHRSAEIPLRVWYSICKNSRFKGFNDLKRSFNAVDKVGAFTVFDIGGNKWRLVTVVHYEASRIYVRHVLTHEEYVRGRWKRE